MRTISVEILRTWLEEHRDVLVLDVRTTSDYQEWAIPGSLHVDAYEALKRHDPQALASLQLDASRPVVTVCGVGKTSQIAAEHLAARGVQVSSLEGGMKAWSLAWNTAEVAVEGSTVQVIQVRRNLHTTQEEAQARAEFLYHSLHKLLSLPAETVVLPGHCSQPVPFDGVPIRTTLAQVNSQIEVLHLTRADFVPQLLSRLPATPPNYDWIVTLNEHGLLPEVPVTELEAGANRYAIS